MLYAAEGMLDDLAATVEILAPPFETFSHGSERVVCERDTERSSFVHRARRTDAAGVPAAVIEIFRPQPAGRRAVLEMARVKPRETTIQRFVGADILAQRTAGEVAMDLRSGFMLRSNQMASMSRWLRAPAGGSTAPGSDSRTIESFNRSSGAYPGHPVAFGATRANPTAEGINEPNQVCRRRCNRPPPPAATRAGHARIRQI